MISFSDWMQGQGYNTLADPFLEQKIKEYALECGGRTQARLENRRWFIGVIRGALANAIAAHGPITAANQISAEKRLVGAILGEVLKGNAALPILHPDEELDALAYEIVRAQDLHIYWTSDSELGDTYRDQCLAAARNIRQRLREAHAQLIERTPNRMIYGLGVEDFTRAMVEEAIDSIRSELARCIRQGEEPL